MCAKVHQKEGNSLGRVISCLGAGRADQNVRHMGIGHREFCPVQDESIPIRMGLHLDVAEVCAPIRLMEGQSTP